MAFGFLVASMHAHAHVGLDVIVPVHLRGEKIADKRLLDTI